jgi:hypothetical protein
MLPVVGECTRSGPGALVGAQVVAGLAVPQFPGGPEELGGPAVLVHAAIVLAQPQPFGEEEEVELPPLGGLREPDEGVDGDLAL